MQRLARISQLPSHFQGQNPADDEEEQAEEQKFDPDDLVVGGEDVFSDEAELLMAVVVGQVVIDGGM